MKVHRIKKSFLIFTPKKKLDLIAPLNLNSNTLATTQVLLIQPKFQVNGYHSFANRANFRRKNTMILDRNLLVKLSLPNRSLDPWFLTLLKYVSSYGIQVTLGCNRSMLITIIPKPKNKMNNWDWRSYMTCRRGKSSSLQMHKNLCRYSSDLLIELSPIGNRRFKRIKYLTKRAEISSTVLKNKRLTSIISSLIDNRKKLN